MDYKKLYEETIEKVKGLIEKRRNGGLYVIPIKDIEDSIPELKEGEDERIKKAIIEHFAGSHSSMYPYKGFTKEQIIAFLEKQGNSMGISEATKQELEDNLNKALEKETPESCNEFLDEQKPADITDEWIEEYWQHEKVNNPYSYNKGDEIQFDYQGFVSFCKKYCQKHAWREEDKRKINRIYSILRQAADTHAFSTTCRLIGEEECIELQDFLKSFRPQNHWKPSEEQFKVLNEVLNFAANHESPHWNDYIFGTLNNLIRQLKKLQS